MKIDSIAGLGIKNLPEINKGTKSDGFKNVLTDFIGDVNSSQMEAKNITKEFMTGGEVEIHEVMVAGQKAKTSLDLLMEIRNKSIDMYKELNRMQI